MINNHDALKLKHFDHHRKQDGLMTPEILTFSIPEMLDFLSSDSNGRTIAEQYKKSEKILKVLFTLLLSLFKFLIIISLLNDYRTTYLFLDTHYECAPNFSKN